MNINEQTQGIRSTITHFHQTLRYEKRSGSVLLVAIIVLATAGKLSGSFLPKTIAPYITYIALTLAAIVALLAIVRIGRGIVPRPEMPITQTPSAIKGPSAFGRQDGELFRRLGRETEIRTLCGYVLDDQVPIVVVMGESGSGKTSLVRAGLEYALGNGGGAEPTVPIYWDALPQDGAEGLLHAIRARWAPHDMSGESINTPARLEDLLTTKLPRRVIIVDHAEQLSPERHVEIFDLLEGAAQQPAPHLITWVVVFRKEYAGTWLEFEDLVPGFHAPRLLLKRFTVDDATGIMATLAHDAGILAEHAVIRRIARSISKDGSVSPADIGISLMVLAELGERGEQVDEALYRSAGEDAGLLALYVRNQMGMLPDYEHEAILRALLHLMDPAIDQRIAEGRSVEQLAAVSGLSTARVARLANYFAGARILERVSERGESYRLAHDRLIPALQHLTGMITANAAETERQFNERFHLWQRNRRIILLLSPGELRRLARYQDQFRWRDDRSEKLEYIRQSRIARNVLYSLAGCCLAFLVVAPVALTHAREAEHHRDNFRQLGLPPDLYDLLPQLDSLHVSGIGFTDHTWIPSSLQSLSLSYPRGSHATLPESFPASLKDLSLDLSYTRGTRVPALPQNLESLVLNVSYTGIERLPELPVHLRKLHLLMCGTEISTLPELPKGLDELSLGLCNTQIAEIPELPEQLSWLELDLNRSITSLPPLPHGFATLRMALKRDQGSEFPHFEMPPQLNSLTLHIESDSVTQIPALPATLKSLTLAVSDSPIPGVQSLPRQLDTLRLTLNGGQVARLATADLPDQLRALFLQVDGKADLDRLQLPPRLTVLGLAPADPSLTVLPAFPRGLRQLLLNVSRTHVRALPPFPAHLQGLGLAQNAERYALPYGNSMVLPGNMFSPLPVLPKYLRSMRLGLQSQRMDALPAGLFPAGLDTLILDLGYTPIKHLPPLPNRLSTLILDVRSTSLSLPRFPEHVRTLTLMISGSQTTSLKALPPRVERMELHLQRSQITTLAAVPRSLSTLSLVYE